MLRIEARLEELGRGDPQNDFFGKYSVLKKRLLEHEYQFTMANFPGGNDHGPNHIRRVLEYLDKLVPESLLSDLNAYELFVLLMSTLYHDEGLLRGRPGHAVASASLVNCDVNTYLVNQEDAAYVSAIVMCHSQSGNIKECLKQFREGEPVRGHTVRPRMIASLVRLADGIDEDTRRADQIVEDKASMPPESAIYWRINQRIKGVIPVPDQLTIKFNVRFDANDLTADYTLSGKRVSVLEAVVAKLAEIDSERKYCVQFLPSAAQYQYIGATFTQVDDVNAVPFDFRFDEYSGEQEFFGRYPRLRSGGVSALDQKMPKKAGVAQRKKIEYLTSVSDECKWVDFKGIPVPGGVLRVEISDMYVEPTATPLSEQEHPSATVRMRKGRPSRHPYLSEFSDRHRKDGSERISSLLKKNYNIVILGDPGSGKTTLLRYIGFHCANGKGQDRFGFDRGLVPIYICLREYAEAFAGGLKPSLLEYLEIHFKKRGLASHLQLVLTSLRERNSIVCAA